MSLMTTTNPASVANEYVTKQSQKLTKMAEYELQLAKFADKEVIGRRNGKTIRYYTEPQGAASQVVALTEGAITSDISITEVETGYVDVTLSPLVWRTEISDLYMSTGFIDKFKMSQRVGAQSIALKADAVIRDAIVAKQLNSDTGARELFSGITATTDSSAHFTTIKSGTASDYKITESSFLQAADQLRLNGYKLKGVVMPRQVFHDFAQDEKVRAALNQAPEKVMAGTLVQYWGTPILVTDRGMQETTYGTYSASGTVFSTFFIAEGSIATPVWDVESAGKDFVSPKWIMPRGADKYDVADTRNPLVAKAYWNCAILKEKGVLILRSRATKTFVV